MTIEIKTATLDPVRNTFSHIERRFGDKPATRYQEATYDLAPTVNFHYKPTWDQDRELNDPRRTAIVMKDWYALKDPRQFYYGSYVQQRAKMQETAEGNFKFFESRDLADLISDEVKDKLIRLFVPLRHVEAAANLNNVYGTAHGSGTAITQALLYEGMDRFGTAQYISRIGLIFDGNTGTKLAEAKKYWMEDKVWQSLRSYMEKTLVTQDWFELFIAQDIVLDTLINDLYYNQLDQWLRDNGARDVSMLTEFMKERAKESERWSNAVLKVVIAESTTNAAQIKSWISNWRIKAQEALAPLAEELLNDQALADAFSVLEKRLSKSGLGS
jgi:phenol hydroxylase P1 protein